ncbi:O-antigen ligase family protein [Puniceicoccus vermicola]|uniref:O-antigen ligase family protein n=1 Tax=Puniceicoccus vermicola TaxID=388746 RepID=A0A7X1AX85_9BACT|nr:O-antigen ligase family protein [Puniceicoccus vermicola]MBC2601602.1 O-antigen ligase family protein [Puniceicoccus vermicola]
MIFTDSPIRSTFGWESPNEAAIFFATLVPFLLTGMLWARKIRIAKIKYPLLTCLMLGEALLYLSLARTGSRSGALALVVGSGFYSLLLWRAHALSPKLWAANALARILLFGVVALFTVTGSRFSPEALLNDRSGEIRLDLWKAGLKMLALEPWTGWGVGQSGLQYMHWFQPPDDPKRVAGTIQSFLHIGVERGIPALWLFTTTVLLLPILSFLGIRRLSPREKSAKSIENSDPSFARRHSEDRAGTRRATANRPALLLASVGAVGAIWFVGNLFSTQWIIPKLWIVPSLSLAFAMILLLFRNRWRVIVISLGTAALVSGVLCAVAFQVGSRIRHSPEIAVEGDWIEILQGAPAESDTHSKQRIVLPDPDILGRDYGRELRKFFAEEEFPSTIVPRYENFTIPTRPYETVIAMGKYVNNALALPAPEILLFHPTVRPDPEIVASPPEGTSVTLFLPDLDVSGYEDLWRKAARREGWKITSTGWTGLDLRTQWPDIALMPVESAE